MYKGKMVKFVDGRLQEFYTIGTVAKILKKSVETLRAWERQKVIPQAMYKSKSVRLYHPTEVDAMKKALRKAGKNARKESIQKEMYAAIREARQEILYPRQEQEEDNSNGP